MNEYLPNGMLGLALAGLLAAFMAGVAANVSAFNTVVTYDLWEPYVQKDRDDQYYVRFGRIATVLGIVIGIGTALIASGYNNIMDYIQTLFSFFNAPLFAIFILGLFWKRMTGTSAWVGLLSGTASAVAVDVLVRNDVLRVSSQAGSFLGASAAFIVGIGVAMLVSTLGRPKPEAELVGLVWSLTPRATRQHSIEGEDAGWYRSPGLLAVLVLVLTLVLYILFL
jgi:SSS family solute:Na+ symporter